MRTLMIGLALIAVLLGRRMNLRLRAHFHHQELSKILVSDLEFFPACTHAQRGRTVPNGRIRGTAVHQRLASLKADVHRPGAEQVGHSEIARRLEIGRASVRRILDVG